MGAGGQREGQDERRHHPLRLRCNEKRTVEKRVAFGEHPGFVRCLSGLASGVRSRAVRSRSAVGFAAVANGGDLDCVFVLEIEENPVVATAEPETGERRFEFFYIAGAIGQVAIHAMENLHRGFAVDGAEIGARLGRPDHGDPLGRWRIRSFTQAELAQDVFVGNAFATRE